MSNLDLTAANGVLKELYGGQKVINMVYQDAPLLALLKKRTDFGGKYYPVPIITGVSQGRSASFTNAQSNQTAAVIKEFLVTRAKDYSIATIDNETMLAAKSDKAAFIQTAKLLVDSAIRSAELSLTSALYRSGTGSIGQISSISTGVITLSNINDVVQFEIGMTLQANATDGGTPRAAVGYVVGVNRTTGAVTVSDTAQGGAAGTPSGWTTSDFLLVQGDVNAKIKGLSAWLPFADPSGSDSFFSVNRSSDRTRLAGVPYDGSSQSVEEALIDGSSLVGREGGKVNYAFMNYASYSGLEKSLGSKVQYCDIRSNIADIGFRGIQINGANSVIRVIADRSCPALTAYLLELSSWELMSLGDAPMILRYGDGNEMLRTYNNDSAELRVGMYGNLVCQAPGHNAVIKLSV